MTEDEFAEAPRTVLDADEPIAITRDGERVVTIVPEPRANGAKINEIARRHGVPLAEGEPDPLLDAVEWIRGMPPELDGDPWRG